MTSFWLTETSMKALMGENYEAFAFFDGTHLFWLALCAVTCVGGSLFYRKANERQRRRTLIVLTLLMLTDEILKYIVTISTGQFEWQFLTFHLCGVNIFVCLWYTIHPNKLAAEILYALCLPGAIVALLVPTWTEMPFGSFVHLHSFSIHVFLESYPWLLLAGGFRPNPKNLPKGGTS